jgi:hypothetical protein
MNEIACNLNWIQIHELNWIELNWIQIHELNWIELKINGMQIDF